MLKRSVLHISVISVLLLFSVGCELEHGIFFILEHERKESDGSLPNEVTISAVTAHDGALYTALITPAGGEIYRRPLTDPAAEWVKNSFSGSDLGSDGTTLYYVGNDKKVRRGNGSVVSEIAGTALFLAEADDRVFALTDDNGEKYIYDVADPDNKTSIAKGTASISALFKAVKLGSVYYIALNNGLYRYNADTPEFAGPLSTGQNDMITAIAATKYPDRPLIVMTQSGPLLYLKNGRNGDVPADWQTDSDNADLFPNNNLGLIALTYQETELLFVAASTGYKQKESESGSLIESFKSDLIMPGRYLVANQISDSIIVDFFYNPDDANLYAATIGKGLWRLDLNVTYESRTWQRN